jgi:hypothetical protein
MKEVIGKLLRMFRKSQILLLVFPTPKPNEEELGSNFSHFLFIYYFLRASPVIIAKVAIKKVHATLYFSYYFFYIISNRFSILLSTCI